MLIYIILGVDSHVIIVIESLLVIYIILFNYGGDIVIKVGARLRELRNRKGLTQAALGNLVGVGQSTIGNIESGFSNPSWELALALAKTLDVTLDDLAASQESTPEVEPCLA